MRSQEQSHLLALALALGLLTCMWVFNVFNWVWNREWLYAVFVFRTTYFLLILCLYFGVVRFFWGEGMDPTWLDAAFSLGALGTTLVSCYFEYELLCEHGLKPWAKWLQYAIFLAVGVIVGLYLIDLKVIALAANAGLVLLVIIAFLVISVWGLQGHSMRTPEGGIDISQAAFIVYYALILLTHPLVNQHVLSLFNLPAQILGMFVFYALVSTFAMTMIVQLRAHALRKKHQQLLLTLALSNERMANERKRREEQSQLLSMLMHEVRNPLSVIELTQSLEPAGNPALVRQKVSVIRSVLEQVLRLEKMIEDQIPVDKQRLAFSACLAQVLEDLGQDASRVACSGAYDAQLCTDAGILHTVLTNLLDNALKYSPPGAVIQLELVAASLPRQLHLVVSNPMVDGDHIDVERVFDKYYRGDGAKRQSGMGLGLYLVQQLVQRMGGNCVCKVVSCHIRFEVCWPVAPL